MSDQDTKLALTENTTIPIHVLMTILGEGDVKTRDLILTNLITSAIKDLNPERSAQTQRRSLLLSFTHSSERMSKICHEIQGSSCFSEEDKRQILKECNKILAHNCELEDKLAQTVS